MVRGPTEITALHVVVRLAELFSAFRVRRVLEPRGPGVLEGGSQLRRLDCVFCDLAEVAARRAGATLLIFSFPASMPVLTACTPALPFFFAPSTVSDAPFLMSPTR